MRVRGQPEGAGPGVGAGRWGAEKCGFFFTRGIGVGLWARCGVDIEGRQRGSGLSDGETRESALLHGIYIDTAVLSDI